MLSQLLPLDIITLFFGYFIIAIFFLIYLPILGKLNFISKEFYRNIVLINDFFSYQQYLFWILFFPFSLWLLSLFLYFINLESLVKSIWVSALIFWLLLYIYIVFILERGALLSKKSFTNIAILSILVTLIFNKIFYIQGLEQLLPQNSIWFWSAFFAFMVSSIWHKQKDVEDRNRKAQHYIQTKAEKFRKKYKSIIKDLPNMQKKLLLAILIMEDYNRPKHIRYLERLLSYIGISKTTGLAQISEKGLSDFDSVHLLKIKIQSECKKQDFHLESARRFLVKYNGNNYDNMVLSIMEYIKID